MKSSERSTKKHQYLCQPHSLSFHQKILSQSPNLVLAHSPQEGAYYDSNSPLSYSHSIYLARCQTDGVLTLACMTPPTPYILICTQGISSMPSHGYPPPTLVHFDRGDSISMIPIIDQVAPTIPLGLHLESPIPSQSPIATMWVHHLVGLEVVRSI